MYLEEYLRTAKVDIKRGTEHSVKELMESYTERAKPKGFTAAF